MKRSALLFFVCLGFSCLFAFIIKSTESKEGFLVFLNGCSSTGRTSIIEEIKSYYATQQRPVLQIGLDTFVNMMPSEYMQCGTLAKQGCYFRRITQNDGQSLIKVEVGDFGRQVFSYLAPAVAQEVAHICKENAYVMLIEEVLYDLLTFQEYGKALEPYKVYFIGITCSDEEREQREKLRGDRPLGLGAGQKERYERYEPFYDLIVDTTLISPLQAAQQIIHFIEENPIPHGFKKAQIKLGQKSN